MNNLLAATELKPRDKQIPATIDFLRSKVNLLQEKLELLLNRTECAMHPSEPKEVAPERGLEVGAPIADSINDIAYTVMGMVERVDDAIERLEL